MKYCPYCGAGLHEKMAFCPKCGQKFVDANDGADQFLVESADQGKHVSNVNKRGSESERMAGTRHNKKPVFVALAVALVLVLCIGLYYFGVFGGSGVPRAVLDSRDAVVRVVSEYEDGFGLGTGFVVAQYSDSSFVITNAHVVEDRPLRISILFNQEEVLSTVQAIDTTKDLCILRTERPISAKAAAFAASDVKQGSVIYAAGFPSAADVFSDTFDSNVDSVTLTNGIVSAIRSATLSQTGSPVTLLQINAAINPGNSGGPLLDKMGRVVGVNTLGAFDSQGIFAAIAASEVLSYLQINNVNVSKVPFSVNIVLLVFAAIIIVIAVVFIAVYVKRSKSKSEFREKKRINWKKTGCVILVVVLVLLAGLVVAYFYSYSTSRKYAAQGEFTKAGQYMIAPDVTKLHDPYLYDYIVAGLNYDVGNYKLAKEQFQSLAQNNYLNSDEMYMKIQETEKQLILEDAINLINQGQMTGLSRAAIAMREGIISETDYERVQNIAYDKAVSLYRAGKKNESAALFGYLKDYKRAKDYNILLVANSVSTQLAGLSLDQLFDLIGFEDADSVILKRYSKEFLVGNWISADTVYYFNLSRVGPETYDCSTNLPGANSYGSRFSIEDGIYTEYQGDGDTKGKDLFAFVINDKNTISVLCDYDKTFIELHRA